MKFLVFSDIHYNPGVSPSGDEAALEALIERAKQNECDFILSGGDFCFGPANDDVKRYLGIFNDCGIPSYHSLGNHDTDNSPLKEVIKYYKMPNNYYYFDDKGYRMIICDANYFLHEGKYYHFDLGNYYPHMPSSVRGIMPPEQLEWLKEAIDSSEYPCIIFNHEGINREKDGIHNMDSVREVIDSANKKKKHSVLMVINGHHHTDSICILENVAYFNLNSASFQVANEHNFFPEELVKKYSVVNRLVFFESPLSAVITLDKSNIKIEGTDGRYFMDITPEKTGAYPYDEMGIKMTASVLSKEISL